VPVAVAEPADARGQALERDALLGHVEPVVEVRIVRHDLLHARVRDRDVLGITAERDPAEGPLSFAEEGPHVRRHEAGDVERALDAHVLGVSADVVAVVAAERAALDHREHRAHLLGHAFLRARDVACGIALAERRRLVEREAARHVAHERIVRGRLLGHEVGRDVALHELGVDVSGVREEADRDRLAGLLRVLDPAERLVERARGLVDVARLEAALDARGIDLDREARGARHGRREGLRAAHAAEARGEDPAPLPGVRIVRSLGEVGLPGGDEGLVRALQDPLRADVDPRAGRHLAVHREAHRSRRRNSSQVAHLARGSSSR
jgi:hypothetical protein